MSSFEHSPSTDNPTSPYTGVSVIEARLGGPDSETVRRFVEVVRSAYDPSDAVRFDASHVSGYPEAVELAVQHLGEDWAREHLEDRAGRAAHFHAQHDRMTAFAVGSFGRTLGPEIAKSAANLAMARLSRPAVRGTATGLAQWANDPYAFRTVSNHCINEWNTRTTISSHETSTCWSDGDDTVDRPIIDAAATLAADQLADVIDEDRRWGDVVTVLESAIATGTRRQQHLARPALRIARACVASLEIRGDFAERGGRQMVFIALAAEYPEQWGELFEATNGQLPTRDELKGRLADIVPSPESMWKDLTSSTRLVGKIISMITDALGDTH